MSQVIQKYTRIRGPPVNSKMRVSHKRSRVPRNIKVVLGYINIDRNIDSKTKVILLSCT